MEFIQRFLMYMAMASLCCLIIGLIWPWVMLWWEDTQTRKKVIKVYGVAALVSYTLYWATVLI